MFSGLKAGWSPSQQVSSAIVAKSSLRECIIRNTCVLIKLYFQGQASVPSVIVFYLVLVGLTGSPPGLGGLELCRSALCQYGLALHSSAHAHMAGQNSKKGQKPLRFLGV